MSSESIDTVQLMYLHFLEEHGRAFRNKGDRVGTNRKFYKQVEKHNKALKTKVEVKNVVSALWRSIKRQGWPVWVRQAEQSTRDLYHRVWNIFHEAAVNEEDGGVRSLASASVPPLLKCEKDVQRKVEVVPKKQPKILIREYLEMRETAIHQKTIAIKICEQQLGVIQHCDETLKNIDEMLQKLH